MDAPLRNALREGMADAVGFVVGALAGWWLGSLLGFDFVRSQGYDLHAIVGLLFIAVGCGLGRWAARRLILRPAASKP